MGAFPQAAALLNLVCWLLFSVGSKIPGVWDESPGGEMLLNAALDHTFGRTWYVPAGSTAAFLLSAFVNNFVNALERIEIMVQDKDLSLAYIMQQVKQGWTIKALEK